MKRAARTLGRVAGAIAVVVASCVIVLIVLIAGLFALYDYRSDKVTGEAARAARAYDRVRVGMTERRVRELAGAPSKRHDACWTWGEGWVFDASTVIEICFAGGKVATKAEHFTPDD